MIGDDAVEHAFVVHVGAPLSRAGDDAPVGVVRERLRRLTCWSQLNPLASKGSELKGKSIIVVQHERPAFAAMTAGKMAGGAIAGASMVSAGNKIVDENSPGGPCSKGGPGHQGATSRASNTQAGARREHLPAGASRRGGNAHPGRHLIGARVAKLPGGSQGDYIAFLRAVGSVSRLEVLVPTAAGNVGIRGEQSPKETQS